MVRFVRVGGVRGSVQAGTQSVRDWLLVAIVGFFNGKMHIKGNLQADASAADPLAPDYLII